jgi:hypothetical protein
MEANMGKDLAKDLATNSGLETDFFNQELGDLLGKYGKSADTISLEDLREILASEIQDVLLEMKNKEEFQFETPLFKKGS